jgi:hypothetical protein
VMTVEHEDDGVVEFPPPEQRRVEWRGVRGLSGAPEALPPMPRESGNGAGNGYDERTVYVDFEDIKRQRRSEEGPPREAQSYGNSQAHEGAEAVRLFAQQWVWRDPTKIAPRPWLLGTTAMIGEVTGFGGLSGQGKTAYLILTALAMTSGRNFTGHHPFKRCRVLYLHTEETDDEFDRRLAAAMMEHSIEPAEVEGWLFHRAAGCTIAKEMPSGEVVQQPDLAPLQAFIKEYQIEVVICDPFITSYEGEENSNAVQNKVLRIWKNQVAAPGQCAVILSHHFRKGTPTPGDADGFRGGRAFVDVCRMTFTITTMSEAEAEMLGIDNEERRALVRIDDAKMNMAAAGKEHWFKLVSIKLGNTEIDPLRPQGDYVHSLHLWTPSDVFQGVPPSKAAEIIDAIDRCEGLAEGERYTDRKDGGIRWAGHLIAQKTGKTDGEAIRILKTWIDSGALYLEKYKRPSKGRSGSKEVNGLYANPAKRPGSIHST